MIAFSNEEALALASKKLLSIASDALSDARHDLVESVPEDEIEETAEGYEEIADAVSVPETPIHLQGYLEAAEMTGDEEIEAVRIFWRLAARELRERAGE